MRARAFAGRYLDFGRDVRLFLAYTFLANIGFGVLKPQVLDASPKTGPFSILPVWHELQKTGRLHGAVMDAFWMHVGDPAARDAAEQRLS